MNAQAQAQAQGSLAFFSGTLFQVTAATHKL